MDFEIGPELRSFRRKVHEFLDEELPDWWRDPFIDSAHVWGFGRRFAGLLASRGWLTLHWPLEHGGRADHWRWLILMEEMQAHRAPWGGSDPAANFIGPAIIAFGTEEQKRRHLPGIANGEVVWCEGFSEPNVGHDIASIQTRAAEDGDSFVVNGEKMWTSYAPLADWCLLMARTDPGADRPHRGLSFLLVDMKSPGVSVRPIRNVIWHPFGQTTFDNVRVPRSNLLGEPGQGFYMSMRTLRDETLATMAYAQSRGIMERFVHHINAVQRNGRRLADDPWTRRQVAVTAAQLRVTELLAYRLVDASARGVDRPDTDMNVAKVWDMRSHQLVNQVVMDALGPWGRLAPECPEAPMGAAPVLDQGLAWHATGSDPASIEIQSMLIATRGLGLPRDR